MGGIEVATLAVAFFGHAALVRAVTPGGFPNTLALDRPPRGWRSWSAYGGAVQLRAGDYLNVNHTGMAEGAFCGLEAGVHLPHVHHFSGTTTDALLSSSECIRLPAPDWQVVQHGWYDRDRTDRMCVLGAMDGASPDPNLSPVLLLLW